MRRYFFFFGGKAGIDALAAQNGNGAFVVIAIRKGNGVQGLVRL
jgi:hypothetical protein